MSGKINFSSRLVTEDTVPFVKVSTSIEKPKTNLFAAAEPATVPVSKSFEIKPPIPPPTITTDIFKPPSEPNKTVPTVPLSFKPKSAEVKENPVFVPFTSKTEESKVFPAISATKTVPSITALLPTPVVVSQPSFPSRPVPMTEKKAEATPATVSVSVAATPIVKPVPLSSSTPVPTQQTVAPVKAEPEPQVTVTLPLQPPTQPRVQPQPTATDVNATASVASSKMEDVGIEMEEEVVVPPQTQPNLPSFSFAPKSTAVSAPTPQAQSLFSGSGGFLGGLGGKPNLENASKNIFGKVPSTFETSSKNLFAPTTVSVFGGANAAGLPAASISSPAAPSGFGVVAGSPPTFGGFGSFGGGSPSTAGTQVRPT